MSERVSFQNDYNTGCHPRILEALSETNTERTTGYGLDRYSEKARSLIKEACCVPDADVQFLVGGTQVNLTVAAGVLRPWQGDIAAETGNINVYEESLFEERAVFERIGILEDGRRICRFVTSFSTEMAEIDTYFDD